MACRMISRASSSPTFSTLPTSCWYRFCAWEKRDNQWKWNACESRLVLTWNMSANTRTTVSRDVLASVSMALNILHDTTALTNIFAASLASCTSQTSSDSRALIMKECFVRQRTLSGPDIAADVGRHGAGLPTV